MTREEIEKEYKVENGIIRSPGKFEGEPVYAPYFWSMFLDGMADEDDSRILWFDVQEDDIEQFPELKMYKQVGLWEDEQGFVRTETNWTPKRERQH